MKGTTRHKDEQQVR